MVQPLSYYVCCCVVYCIDVLFVNCAYGGAMFAWTEKDWIRCVSPIEVLVHLACRRLPSIGIFKYIYVRVLEGTRERRKRQLSRSRPARP